MSNYLSPLELANPQVLGLPHTSWRPNQLAAFETALALHKAGGGFLFTQQPTGCHAKGQLLLMADGHTIPVENVKVGDQLMGMDGAPRTVLSLIHGEGRLFKVIPENGNPFTVNRDHVLTLGRMYKTNSSRLSVLDIRLYNYLGWSANRKQPYRLLRVEPPFANNNPIDFVLLGLLTPIEFSIEPANFGEFFGFTLDGDGRYLLSDFTVTHNSGKSGVATALGAFENVTTLVGTLNLIDQYHLDYSFSAIKGRANYLCADVEKIDKWGGNTAPTAADCHLSSMHKCAYADSCEYLQVKSAALAARRLVVTYPYAMLSRSVQDRSGILVCDEAHAAVDEIIGFSTFEVSPRYCDRWSLPDFPLPTYGAENKGDILAPYSLNLVMQWFDRSIAILSQRKAREGKISRAHAAHAHLELYRENVTKLPQEEWFLEVHPSPICVFRLRPLTAVVAAKLLFTPKKTTVVLMSATIGDPAPLAAELGVDTYAWEDYPHPIPPSARPVFDLGIERMTHENLKRNPNLFRIQAQTIRAWISTLNPAWRGIILTSSYAKIRELADVLVPAMPERNFLVQKSGDTVSGITDAFLRHHYPGDVLIASIQGFGHGLDLRGDLARFCVVAGVPHSNPFDRYEQLRKKRNGPFGWWQAYCAIVQAAGRVSRGELDENGTPLLNMCALADGSATAPLAYKYYPSWFVEAIQKF